MTSPESREFIRLRSDGYAAELSKCPAPIVLEPERDEQLWVCRCCGKRKPISPMQHVCAECQEEAA